MNSVRLKNSIVNVLEKNKAIDISIFNISKITDISDYLVICSATSSRHIKALSNYVIEKTKKHGIMPIGSEGKSGEEGWALIDLGDIIIHIMIPEIREFYNLEKLWSITPTVSSIKKPKKEAIMAVKKSAKKPAKKVTKAKKPVKKVAKRTTKAKKK